MAEKHNWGTQARRWILTRLAAALREVADDAPARSAQPQSQSLSVLNTGQKTRLCALVALGLSAASFSCTAILIYALWSNVESLKKAGVIPKLDANFDAVAAAAAVGRLDVISIVLTFLGIVAALGVLYGWTAFRAAAVSAAIEELENRLPDELREYMAKKGAAAVSRALENAELLARLQARFTSLGIGDTEEAMYVDDEPDFRGE